MRKHFKLKLALISFLVLVGLCSGVYYYVSYKINGEELKNLAVMALQKSFPRAKVEVGEIDLEMGGSINLSVKGVSLQLPGAMIGKGKKAVDIFKVEDVDIQIPVFTVLFNRGTIRVNLDKSELHYQEFAHKNNWRLATGDKKKEKSEAKGKGGYSLPAFLARVRATP